MDWIFFPFDFLERIYDINSVPFSKKKLKRGKNYAKDVHCVIGSLLRDAEDSYDYGVKMVEKFSKTFKTVDVFILENDSKDNTRRRWQKYSTKCPENVKIIVFSPDKTDNLLKNKTINHDISYIRIKKMVKLRNILLETIKEKSRKFDYESYIFITDLDIKGDGLIKEGIYDTFYYFNKNRKKYEKDKINAIGCNGLTWKCFYFDDYAYKNSCSRPTRIYSAVDVPINRGLYPVVSTFSGGVFYRYDILIGLKYKLKKGNRDMICEHITLNEKIKNMYINTNMIYHIASH